MKSEFKGKDRSEERRDHAADCVHTGNSGVDQCLAQELVRSELDARRDLHAGTVRTRDRIEGQSQVAHRERALLYDDADRIRINVYPQKVIFSWNSYTKVLWKATTQRNRLLTRSTNRSTENLSEPHSKNRLAGVRNRREADTATWLITTYKVVIKY